MYTRKVLGDLDYADDIALFAHTHQHIEKKTISRQVGLNITIKKSEIM